MVSPHHICCPHLESLDLPAYHPVLGLHSVCPALALDPGLALALDQELAPGLALDQGLALALDQELAPGLALDLDQELALGLALDLDLAPGWGESAQG